MSYLDGKIIDGAPACCESWLVDGLGGGRGALERGDASVQPCDLSLLFLELPSLLLDLLMGDGLSEMRVSGRRLLDHQSHRRNARTKFVNAYRY